MTRSLDELRDVAVADVLKMGVKAATFRRLQTGVELTYDPDYSGAPIATTLPVTTEPLVTLAGALPPFFTGLLPEGRRLGALRRAVKTSADDELTLLLAVGANLVGDVQVVPAGETPEVSEAIAVASWSEVRFVELLADEFDSTPDRSGLAGVQDKVSAAMITLPVRRRHESFILKLDPPEFPHLVVNEATMMRAAVMAGLEVAKTEVVHDGEGTPGLLVTRFDRTPGGALAVEDGCQVMGRYPADKYSVSSEAVCMALADRSDAPLVAGRTLVRWFAFAYLSCNGDLHAKNLSILELRSGVWRVAPAYDLPASYPYGDNSMALSVNGKRRDNIGLGDFIALGAALGVPERAVTRVVSEVVESADGWLPLIDDLPFDGRLLRKWQRAVNYRRRRLSPS